MTARTYCNNCTSSDGLASYSDGDYCHSCKVYNSNKKMFVLDKPKVKFAVPKPDKDNLFPLEVIEYLKQYYITSEDIEDCGIFWSKEYRRIIFPFPVNNSDPESKQAWARSIIKNKVRPKWLYLGEKSDFPYIAINGNGPQDTVVFVEDAISAIRVSQFVTTTALGGTTFVEALKEPILQLNKVILWLDSDEAGQKATQKFLDDYWFIQDRITVIKTHKDPKCYSPEEIKHFLGLE